MFYNDTKGKICLALHKINKKRTRYGFLHYLCGKI